MSGGQKQRVSLAGVLIDESPILLFDEPLANLDPQTCLETMDLIKDIHENNEVTTIIIEHRIEEVLPLGIDKIVVVNDGEIVAIGSPAELLKTEIFNENSLREPLYLSALKAANATKLLTDFSDLKSFEVLSAKKLLTDFLDTYKFTDKAVSKNNILSVKNLSVNFAQHEVLKGINIEVQEGEKISIVGKNGVGKSTFANALCHFVEASGEILYRGQSIIADSISERAKKLAILCKIQI